MHTRGPVHMKPGLLAKVESILAREGKDAADKVRTIKRKRGGQNRQEHSGPSGYRLRPARKLARAMADLAAEYRTRGRTKSAA